MKLIYNSVDISNKVEIIRCTHDSYAEGNADTLNLVLRDNNRLWDKWGPAIGDEVQIENGNQKTGIMYIKQAEPQSGVYNIRATSLPITANETKSNAWEQITFYTVAKQVADDLGFEIEMYNAPDQLYKYLRQENERGIDLLQRLCILQGCAFLIFDKKIILYSQQFIDDQAAVQSIFLRGDSNLKFKKTVEYSGCLVSNGTYSALYKKDLPYSNILEQKLDIYIGSRGEAIKYAENMLRYLNRNSKSGYFYSSPIAEAFTAGTVINIESDVAGSYNGKIFICHIRHEYHTNTSKIFFRE